MAKSIDILTKEAQDRLDAMLAEIDRLKNVKIGLENSNKADEELFKKDQENRRNILKAIEDDTNIALNNKKQALDSYETESAKLTDLKEKIKELDSTVDNLEHDIFVRTEKLEALQNQIDAATKNIKNLKDDNAALMRSYEQEAMRFIEASNQQKNEMAAILTELKKKSEALSSDIDSKKAELSSVNKEVKAANNEIGELQIKKDKLSREFSDLNDNLNIIKSEIDTNTTLLESKKKELEAVESELKPLIAKRIDSANFIEQLNNREATLKKRYEDVGLEYPV